MKLSTLSLIATYIFICFATVAYYNTQSEANVNTIKRQYRSYMAAACESAMNSVEIMDFASGSLFAIKSNRQVAVETFFLSLAKSFNREGIYADEIINYVPVVVLVDYDGFYVWHSGQTGAASVAAAMAKGNWGNIEEFRSWSEMLGDYVIRYYLDDDVKITNIRNGSVYYAEREDMYNLINDDLLWFLNDKEAFDLRKATLITADIKETIEYYINNNDNLNVSYNIEFATLDDENWGRLFKTPTILTFLQGKQLEEINSNIVLNIYSFSGTELTGTYHYFIDDSNRYHCLEELMDNGSVINIGGKYYHEGVVITNIYNSMEECARLGAYPATGSN